MDSQWRWSIPHCSNLSPVPSSEHAHRKSESVRRVHPLEQVKYLMFLLHLVLEFVVFAEIA
jgi:hypothetical protein